MKGTFFQKPFEFNLLVEGETWRQGDPIKGTLTVKNRGDQPSSTSGISVSLSHGLLRKVHKKDEGALNPIETAAFTPETTIKAQSEASYSWTFPTDKNSPITEHLSSLFLVYGQGEAAEKKGALQLNLIPYQTLEDFLNVLQIQNRFVKKSQKTSKGKVETKFDPPTAKGFAMVELLVVSTCFKEEDLHVSYVFHLSKMEPTPSGMVATKTKRAFEQVYTPMDYRISSGRFNHERMEAGVREILNQIESKVLY